MYVVDWSLDQSEYNNGQGRCEGGDVGKRILRQNLCGGEISEWKILRRKQISEHYRSCLWSEVRQGYFGGGQYDWSNV